MQQYHRPLDRRHSGGPFWSAKKKQKKIITRNSKEPGRAFPFEKLERRFLLEFLQSQRNRCPYEKKKIVVPVKRAFFRRRNEKTLSDRTKQISICSCFADGIVRESCKWTWHKNTLLSCSLDLKKCGLVRTPPRLKLCFSTIQFRIFFGGVALDFNCIIFVYLVFVFIWIVFRAKKN